MTSGSGIIGNTRVGIALVAALLTSPAWSADLTGTVPFNDLYVSFGFEKEISKRLAWWEELRRRAQDATGAGQTGQTRTEE